ncbi:MFS transporter [Nocardia arizonensis]|uniref:MFS transporter n=1 Tax=Nocardia arizonensis TaxID=1141647 RepID=UPI0006D2045B|nr:MFS transporter [Nocardia arizonensis]
MTKVDRRLRLARAAVFTVFALNGFLLALWVVHIPQISDRTGIAESTLGTFILALAGAALIGMRAAGPLADRYGSRTLVAIAGAGIAVAVIGPGLATGPVWLAIALACFGFGNGALDVSMNTQAVLVERAYGRPIMSAFHALFSGGGLLGSLLGSATQRAGLDIRLTLALSAVAALALLAVVLPLLLREPRTPSRAGDHVESMPLSEEWAVPPADTAPTGRASRWKVLGLAAVAFIALLTEGAAADWSALQVRDHLGADEATAALAFGGFSFSMTAGRFATDRIAGAFGRVAVVRYGCLICALGLTLVVTSGIAALTLLGWALVGLGLSGTVPQIFTAAGNLGSATAATDMSRVFAIGYLGLLAGPAMIGWATAAVPLTTALLIPLVAVLICAWSARVVAPPRPLGDR